MERKENFIQFQFNRVVISQD